MADSPAATSTQEREDEPWLVLWRRRVESSTPLVWWLPLVLIVASEY
jgi:hypothetical protein